MYYDWTYILLLPALILAAYAQSKVSSTYSKYAKVRARSNITAAQLARQLLEAKGQEVLKDDDPALSKRLEALSSDEAETQLQLAIDVNSTRCTALLLNHRAGEGQPHFVPSLVGFYYPFYYPHFLALLF